METATPQAWELPRVGDLLGGKYRIERLIGQGGMGAVFLARHEILGEPVALKFLLPTMAAHPQASMRFLNEARNSARLRSEHVAKVLDVDSAPNGGAYMVLEFLEGTDLAGLLAARGALGLDESADYVLQALEALAHAHSCGIVHRDLKPANLFLARRADGTAIVKVLDFGISKAGGGAGGVTNTSAMLGSPCFMAPEQVRSSRSVDPRADIWSVGVILYNLLTGTLPFQGENFGEVLSAVLEGAPPPMRALRPELPVEIERLVSRCLQRDREARFPDVAELAEALSPFCSPGLRPLVATVRRILSMAPAGGPSYSSFQASAPSLAPLPSASVPAAPATPRPSSTAPFEETAARAATPIPLRRVASAVVPLTAPTPPAPGASLEDDLEEGEAETLRRAPAVGEDGRPVRPERSRTGSLLGEDDDGPTQASKAGRAGRVSRVSRVPRQAVDDDATEASPEPESQAIDDTGGKEPLAAEAPRRRSLVAPIAVALLLVAGAAAAAFVALRAEPALQGSAAGVDAGAPATVVAPVGEAAPVPADPPATTATTGTNPANGSAETRPAKKPKAAKRPGKAAELDELLLDRN